jgi:hypothetical protein
MIDALHAVGVGRSGPFPRPAMLEVRCVRCDRRGGCAWIVWSPSTAPMRPCRRALRPHTPSAAPAGGGCAWAGADLGVGARLGCGLPSGRHFIPVVRVGLRFLHLAQRRARIHAEGDGRHHWRDAEALPGHARRQAGPCALGPRVRGCVPPLRAGGARSRGPGRACRTGCASRSGGPRPTRKGRDRRSPFPAATACARSRRGSRRRRSTAGQCSEK